MADQTIDAYADGAVRRGHRPRATSTRSTTSCSAFARAIEGNDELRDALTDPHLPAATPPADRRGRCSAARPPTSPPSLVSMVVGTGRGRELPAHRRRPRSAMSADSGDEVRSPRSARPSSSPRTSATRLAAALSKAHRQGRRRQGHRRPDRPRRHRHPDRRHRHRRHRPSPPRPAPRSPSSPHLTRTNQRKTPHMAELTINTADITAALHKNLEGFTPDARGHARSAASSRSATASPACRACPTPPSTSCSSSRAAPSASP